MKLSDCIGETSSYDKKLMLERDNPVSWLKSVSAFANTLGGKLLFADKSPVRQSRVFCTRWNGLTKTDGTMEADDDDEFSGGLIKLMDEAIDFVRANSKKKWRKTLKGRVEYPDYPPDAVREGVVNALIHRDYLEIGSEVHIDIFDDRLEIYSPGGMVSGLLVQNVSLRKVGSKRRNPVIADLFQRMRLMERRGSGFGKIIDAYKTASERIGREVTPTFSSDAADFFLTLPNLNYGLSATSGTQKSSAKSSAKSSGKSSAKSSGKRANAKSEKSARIILRAIKSDTNVSVRELQLRTHLSNSGVRKIIAQLKVAGSVRRVGGTNGGHWEVVGL